MGKGILVCATTHGNVFVGPNAQDMPDSEKDDTAVTIPGMDDILDKARRLVPNIPVGATITEFAGVRAYPAQVTSSRPVGKDERPHPAAGIQSPGLTSAPAIAKYLVDGIVAETGAAAKTDYKKGRPAQPCFRMMAEADQKASSPTDPRYGRVICRCETITEGEIDRCYPIVPSAPAPSMVSNAAPVPAWAAARVASADRVLHRSCPVN